MRTWDQVGSAVCWDNGEPGLVREKLCWQKEEMAVGPGGGIRRAPRERVQVQIY